MRDLKWVYLSAFGFVVIAGTCLQLIVLPMTSWHAGAGLMAGGDWVYFHQLAVELAGLIRQEGWSAWLPRVEGQAPASVAAALYVLTGIERPWVLLPIHGALYGVSALALYDMARKLGCNARQSWLVLIPLFLFPSSAMIWGQIHKDIYSITGALLVARFWLKVWVAFSKNSVFFIKLVPEFSFLIFGLFLIGYVRPYLLEIVLLAGLPVAAFLTFCFFCAFFASSKDSSFGGKSFNPSYRIIPIIILGLLCHIGVIGIERFEKYAVREGAVNTQNLASVVCPVWTASLYLPNAIDQRLGGLACARIGFSENYPVAGSNIDVDVRFSSAEDVVAYLPRALQISFFAPFPSHWFDNAVQPGGRIMRLLVIPEMLVLYLAVSGIVFALISPAVRVQTFLLLVFSILIVLVHALVVANVGTLYRMRYPSMLIWILLGVVGWCSVIRLRDSRIL